MMVALNGVKLDVLLLFCALSSRVVTEMIWYRCFAAMRIHISQSTRDSLVATGDKFILSERGEVELKVS